MDDLPSEKPSREQRSSVRGERCPNCGQPLVLGQCTFCGYRPGVSTAPPPVAPAAASTSFPTMPAQTQERPSPPEPAPSSPPAFPPPFRPTPAAAPPPAAPPPPRPANANANANNPWIIGLACVTAVLLVLSVFLLLQ